MYIYIYIYIYIYTCIHTYIQVTVEYQTRLEVCWSTVHGFTAYSNIFTNSERTSFVFLDADPPQLTSYRILNPLPLSVHTQISFSLYGRGLRSSGPSSLLVGLCACVCVCVSWYIDMCVHACRYGIVIFVWKGPALERTFFIAGRFVCVCVCVCVCFFVYRYACVCMRVLYCCLSKEGACARADLLHCC
jgi:hypothetical protein